MSERGRTHSPRSPEASKSSGRCVFLALSHHSRGQRLAQLRLSGAERRPCSGLSSTPRVPSGDDELDLAVTKTTEDEFAHSWLTGPWTEKLWTRWGFGFQFRDSWSSKVIPSQHWTTTRSRVRTVRRPSRHGRRRRGRRDRQMFVACGAWRRLQHPALHWRGGQYDNPPRLDQRGFGGGLSMVYQQLARCPAHAALTVVASWCGRPQTTKLYEQPVLAFGATLSVMSFCLVARALWHVAVVLAQITWTHFVDDCPCVPELESFIDGFFDLFVLCVKDLARFALSFPALGVVFTFPAEDRTVVVANTQSRMQSLSDSVSGISGPTLLTNKVATTLRCKTAICPYPGIRQMRRSRFPLAGSGRRRTELFSERRVRRVARIAFLGQGTARHPHSAQYQPHSPDQFSCTQTTRVRRATVTPLAVLDSLGFGSQRKVVGQAPVLIVKMAWPEEFAGRLVVTFVDNHSARHSLIAGYSPSMASSRTDV